MEDKTTYFNKFIELIKINENLENEIHVKYLL